MSAYLCLCHKFDGQWNLAQLATGPETDGMKAIMGSVCDGSSLSLSRRCFLSYVVHTHRLNRLTVLHKQRTVLVVFGSNSIRKQEARCLVAVVAQAAAPFSLWKKKEKKGCCFYYYYVGTQSSDVVTDLLVYLKSQQYCMTV